MKTHPVKAKSHVADTAMKDFLPGCLCTREGQRTGTRKALSDRPLRENVSVPPRLSDDQTGRITWMC